METYKINSSHIISVDYDQYNLTLIVHYTDGKSFEYSPFYENQLADFLVAESKGKWFIKNIKSSKFIRVRSVK